MATGFTPKYTEEIFQGELNIEQFLALLLETANNLNWKISSLSHNGLIAYTTNGLFKWNACVKIQLKDELASIQSESTGSEIIDFGKNKKTVLNFIAEFNALKASLSTEELDCKHNLLRNINEEPIQFEPVNSSEKRKGFFSVFIPQGGFFITPILLNLNILLFIALVIAGANVLSPSSEMLIQWGANFGPLTLNGEWWRIISCCFLHIGVIHLLMNMYALLYVGVLLEPIIGRTRFLSTYLFTGVAASLTSLWWNGFIISAGASGAIFGMYGVFLALLTTKLIEKDTRKEMLISISIFVAYNLIYGFKDGIDNAAHIGGLLSGLCFGYALIPSLKNTNKPQLKYGTIALLSLVMLCSSFGVITKLYNDISTYETKMEEFASMEAMALAVFQMPENTKKEILLRELKSRGLYYWKECLVLLDNCDELRLPSELVERNQDLREYCELRIKCYELIYKAVNENTDKYRSEIENYGKLIRDKTEASKEQDH